MFNQDVKDISLDRVIALKQPAAGPQMGRARRSYANQEKQAKRRLGNRGQATTEYILILSVSALLGLAVVKTLIKPAYDQVASLVSNAIQNSLFGVNLHTFNVPH